MKKSLIYLFVLILVPFFSIPPASAEDCPFGITNDPYPGTCNRYIDGNGNDVCDLSEIPLNAEESAFLSEEALKALSVKEMAAEYGVKSRDFADALSEHLKITVNPNDLMQALHDDYGLCMGVAGSLAAGLEPHEDSEAINPASEANPKPVVARPKYELVSIILVIVIIYLFTYILYQKKVISLMLHRQLWNFVLLLSFLACGLSGLLLVLRINYGWVINFPFSILYWHVETGIVMAVISFFHIVWHWQYYTSIFRRNQ